MKVFIGKYTKTGKRKVSVQVSTEDTFSLDHTLALVILSALKAYKKQACGRTIWGSLCAGICYNHPLTKKEKLNNKKIYKEAEQKMNDIVDKMINAFEFIAKDDIAQNDVTKEGVKLFAEYYFNLWW